MGSIPATAIFSQEPDILKFIWIIPLVYQKRNGKELERLFPPLHRGQKDSNSSAEQVHWCVEERQQRQSQLPRNESEGQVL